jgi:type I restriction enzyme, S subunit
MELTHPPDWKTSKIGSITDVFAGGTPSTGVHSFWGGNIRWMNSGELNLRKVFEVENRITEDGLKNSSARLIPKNCVLIGLAGQGKTRGTVAINRVELTTNQSVAAIYPSIEFVPEYLYYNLDLRYKEIRDLSDGGGGRGGLNLKLIKSIEIPLPERREQEAIASALSDIDELIESIDTEIRKKQNIQKGFQQSLVAGDYFKQNNISFEIKQIQNLPIEIQRGHLITGTKKIDGRIPVVAGGISAAYYNNVANRFGTTITISASGANAGFVNLWRCDIWASDCSTIGESEMYEVLYIFYVLKEKQGELFDSQYGGGQPHIRPKEIGEISIPWISKANQTKLVIILEGLSKELELLEKEKIKYECIKRGMAHDLLTGKVRLV